MIKGHLPVRPAALVACLAMLPSPAAASCLQFQNAAGAYRFTCEDGTVTTDDVNLRYFPGSYYIENPDARWWFLNSTYDQTSFEVTLHSIDGAGLALTMGSAPDIPMLVNAFGDIRNTGRTIDGESLYDQHNERWDGGAALSLYMSRNSLLTVNTYGALENIGDGHGLYILDGGPGSVDLNVYNNVSSAKGAGIRVEKREPAIGGVLDISVANGATITGQTAGIRTFSYVPSTLQLIDIGAGSTISARAGSVIESTSPGLRVIRVGQGATIAGRDAAFLFKGVGDARIDNAGLVGTTPEAVAVWTNDLASVEIVNRGPAGANGGGTLIGRLVLAGGNDRLDNLGLWRVAGDNLFGTADDQDRVTNGSTGVIALAGATQFIGLERFDNQGQLKLGGFDLTGSGLLVNSGTITTPSATAGGRVRGFTTIDNLGSIGSALAFGDGADLFRNAGGWTTAGVTDFGGGADRLDNSGTITLAADAAWRGLESFEQDGVLDLGNHALAGSGLLTNRGLLHSGSGALAGFTGLINSGQLAVDQSLALLGGGTLRNDGLIVAGAASQLTGQQQLVNAGRISLVDGIAGQSLTVGSDYAGAAGRLALDAGPQAADRIRIQGQASGNSFLDLNLTGSAFGAGDRVLIEMEGGAAPGAFTLGTVSGAASPLIRYALRAAGSAIYLDTALSPVGTVPMLVVPLAQERWLAASAGLNRALSPGRTGFWAAGQVARTRIGQASAPSGPNDGAPRIDTRLATTLSGGQAGYSLPLSAHAQVGFMAGLGTANARHDLADFQLGDLELGAYARIGAGTGPHAAALLLHQRGTARLANALFASTRPTVRTTGVDAELGYDLPVGANRLDLRVGANHAVHTVDDQHIDGLTYAVGPGRAATLRGGARLAFGGAGAPWLAVDHHRAIGDAPVVAVGAPGDAIDHRVRPRHHWTRLSAGLGTPGSRALDVSLWGDLGDSTGVGARIAASF